MADYPHEEYTRVVWIPGASGVADLDSPELAEVNAVGAVDLSCLITKDGLARNITSNTIPTGSLCTRFDSEVPGSSGAKPTITFKRKNGVGEDDAWDLVNWGDEGTLIIRVGLRYDVAFAEGQEVEAFHGQWTDPRVANSAQNAMVTFDADLAIHAYEAKAVIGGAS